MPPPDFRFFYKLVNYVLIQKFKGTMARTPKTYIRKVECKMF